MTHNEPDHFPDASKMIDLAARIERAEGPDRAPERILVCGGRNFDDGALLEQTLNQYTDSVRVIIEGGAPGADRLARTWAQMRRIEVLTFYAQWKRHGKAAGPIRNSAMLANGRPDLVVAFEGGRGTADMVTQAKLARVPVIEVAAAIRARSAS